MKTFMQAAAVLLASVALSPANALVIGAADSSNSIPFGSTLGGYYYQQVYSAASFASGININEITFYNSLNPGGTPRAGTFDLYLSTTNAAVGTFDTSAMTYPDASFTQVYHGALPSLASGRFDFSLSSVFNYNPAMGNLVLTIKSFDLVDGSNFYLDIDRNVGVTNSRFSAYPYDWNQGLVTGFNDSVAGAVPEPSTWAMMLIGFAGLGYAGWRKGRPARAAA